MVTLLQIQPQIRTATRVPHTCPYEPPMVQLSFQPVHPPVYGTVSHNSHIFQTLGYLEHHHGVVKFLDTVRTFVNNLP